MKGARVLAQCARIEGYGFGCLLFTVGCVMFVVWDVRAGVQQASEKMNARMGR